MTRPGLIDSTLEDVGLVGGRIEGKFTPATGPSHPSPGAPPMDASWDYRSIIGKLNFLADNTRPDVSVAVHQAARFLTRPNKTHQLAVKCIFRHSHKTRDRGLIMRPNGDSRLDACVDADFAGLWSTKTSHTRESALSRTGFVIAYGGCPVHWVSRLQTEIASSTCESESQALSMCMRQLTPMRSLLRELSTRLKTPDCTGTLLQGDAKAPTKSHRSVVHKDNKACLGLVMSPEQHRPRTKHIGVKWPHFRGQIAQGDITVQRIDTNLDWADIFTKALPRTKFELLRMMMMGWQSIDF